MEHSRFGYSAVSTFKQCPLKYKLEYIDHMKVLDEYDPKDALKVGTMLHKAIETDTPTATHEYMMSYPIATDQHYIEADKVRIQAEKVRQIFDNVEGEFIHEYHIESGKFVGTIDLLHKKSNGHYDMFDFKYSNHTDNYKKSPQLSIYKYFFEQVTGNVVDNMGYIVIPKDIDKNPILIQMKYHPEWVQEFIDYWNIIDNASAFPKTENQYCRWCKYNKYCLKGDLTMILPSSERRTVGTPTKRKIWIYGATMSGKTTLIDDAPNRLNINTDGNIQFVTMPYIAIKDDIQVEGRITKKTLAWEVFKNVIAELEKNQNDFKTVAADLVEDLYESCRLYMYDKLGITHESDDTFRAWDKVRTEYLSTMRRFFNLDYENIIIISHEDMSKDITKKTGDKITAIKPNINDKVANKLAGMVDIVARVVVEDDGSRTLNFKSNEVIFGGGRLKNITETQIPLSWDALMKVYGSVEVAPKKEVTNLQKAVQEEVEKITHVGDEEPPFMSAEPTEIPFDSPEVDKMIEELTPAPQEEASKRRTRRTRGE